MNKKIKNLEMLIERKHIQVISIDVFDTLLLRSTCPELFRFRKFSKAQCNALSFSDSDDSKAFYLARLKAGKSLYDRSRKENGSFEVTYSAILREMSECDFFETKLDETGIQKCLKIELELEKKELSPNKNLWSFLKRQCRLGRKIIFCSDMYLDAESISFLLTEMMDDVLCGHIIVSSEWQKTKRHGSLFKKIIRDLNIQPHKVLHIGDNWISDVKIPDGMGICTYYLPRTVTWKMVHGIRKRLYEFYLKAIIQNI